MDTEPHISIESETTQGQTPVILDGNQISQTAFSSFPDTKYGTVVWQILLSKPSTSSDSMCVGIATCPPNGTLALHQHSQAEVYYVLEGTGEVEIDGVRHHVKAGAVLWIPGNAMHGAFCGPDESLKWFYVFPEARFEDIIYKFKYT
ncbi:cupin 2 conserved barrel protein [Fusarium langsethiae]|uniref:Cupin 2 conserved barrel protein n=1 Tax=Fusarium langsethiae TaxID=179993 RepID=A0A0M9EMV4_FUSLA|nr:cupin 2 conserved barrel protein [Fusarium langsethiae]